MRALALLLVAHLCHSAEGKWMLVEATAYCPCHLCCDRRTNRTADGTNTNATPYGIAASPNLPLGGRIYIPAGLGYLDSTRRDNRFWAIDDRGGALRSDWQRSGITRIDLRYKHHWAAQQFGRKLITVYVEMP